VSVDPLVDVTGLPYAYTGDDPVNGVDPLGLDCGLFSSLCAAYDAGAGAVKSGAASVASDLERQWNSTTLEVCVNVAVAQYCEGDQDGHAFNSYGLGLGIPGVTASQGSYCPYGTALQADANFGVGGGTSLGTGNPAYFYEVGTPGAGLFLMHTRSGLLPPLLQGL
jgi:hypothetical protein